MSEREKIIIQSWSRLQCNITNWAGNLGGATAITGFFFLFILGCMGVGTDD